MYSTKKSVQKKNVVRKKVSNITENGPTQLQFKKLCNRIHD